MSIFPVDYDVVLLEIVDIREDICFSCVASLLQELNGVFSDLYNAYQHFIGQPHFDALLELLSYEDVAMLLKELMESIRNLVCYSLFSSRLEYFCIKSTMLFIFLQIFTV